MIEITNDILEDMALKIVNLLQLARRMQLIQMSATVDGHCDVLHADVFPVDTSYPRPQPQTGISERAHRVFVSVRVTDDDGNKRPDFAIQEDYQSMADTVNYLQNLILQGEPLTLANTVHKDQENAA